MFRRCISILVLVGYLAGQLAAVPHAHGGYSAEQRREHDARPHVHFGHGWHCHHHHDGSSAAVSHGHKTQATSSLTSPARLAGDDGYRDHDGDAVYLPNSAMSSVAVEGQRTLSDDLSTAPLADIADLPVPPGRTAYPFHPPDGASVGAKLFLTLRTLRI